MFDKLEAVEMRFQQINDQLQEPGIVSDQNKYRQLMIEMADLEKVVKVYQHYKKAKQQLTENIDLLSDEKDEELRQMIKEENSSLEKQIPILEQELKLQLLPKDPNDGKNVILEIRAGAGGDEASLFAEELFRGYSLFASNKGWQSKILSISEGNAGGCKEIIARVSGDKVFSMMKYESGVHRVQRVPKTESQGRVHTSTVTVAVIPEVEETDIKIEAKDIRVDVYRSSGHGGQSVNTTDSAVRITHIPSGLVVTCQDGKSQLSNKEQAMKVLYSRLQQIEDDKKRKEASDERLSQIGSGDRSERIRTYNFPQSRITDHRIGFTTHQIDAIMSGDFSLLMDPLITHYQSEALKKQNQI